VKTLQTRNLTLGYDGLPVIHDLDLQIPAGKITALVGSNGCGKSTLLRSLARLMSPRGGAVYLDNAAIAKLPTKEVAKQLGILPQGPVAPEGLTVRELVAQGRYPHQSWFSQWSEADEAVVSEALSATAMTELAERPLEALSGGQRQRAWIAMALAQGTEILLLDEPTTYLDMAHQIDVLDLLYELNRNEGRTIVLVLHDLNQACRYADHIVALKNGRVFAAGEPAEVLTEDLVHCVFGMDCRIISDPVSGTPLCVPVGRNRCPVLDGCEAACSPQKVIKLA
jgi:iron complex transport system ATP-binding protein